MNQQQQSDTFPNFDLTVPDDGYAWWYVDAVSDDGKHALTIITFIGSVFSPYYAWARNRSPADPLNYCAINVALYSRRGKRWAMTERPRASVSRSRERLNIGPSYVEWDGNALLINIDEVSVPLPSRLRGQVRVIPSTVTNHDFALDKVGHHRWRPVAPCARVEVAMQSPQLKWSGEAYMDSNVGSRPLEKDFTSWHWSRSSAPGGSTAIMYEGNLRQGGTFSMALKADPEGAIETFEAPDTVGLPTTMWWRIARETRAEEGQSRVSQTLEDTPFYARSLLQSKLGGEPLTTVHESLSLERFSTNWVRCLLPFRMPRLNG